MPQIKSDRSKLHRIGCNNTQYCVTIIIRSTVEIVCLLLTCRRPRFVHCDATYANHYKIPVSLVFHVAMKIKTHYIAKIVIRSRTLLSVRSERKKN